MSSFIQGFANNLVALHGTILRLVQFKWTSGLKNFFNSLTETITFHLLLVYLELGKRFIAENDIPLVVLGSILSQNSIDVLVHSVQYVLCTMIMAKHNFPICMRETLSVEYGFCNFQMNLLLSKLFVLYTDQKALMSAYAKRNVHERMGLWLKLLSKFEFEFKYDKGIFNGVVDHLFHIFDAEEDNLRLDDGNLNCKISRCVA